MPQSATIRVPPNTTTPILQLPTLAPLMEPVDSRTIPCVVKDEVILVARANHYPTTFHIVSCLASVAIGHEVMYKIGKVNII